MNQSFDLLLAGAGHAHLGVLRRWAEPSARHNRPTGRIGLLSADGHAWYSGMLPGLLSGRYQLAECRIELDALCRAAGVELLIGQATGLDSASQQLQLSDDRVLDYNYLSLNLGSLPALPAQSGCGLELLAVKPFSAFIQGWQRWQAAPQALAILGGGAAGVELALALAPQVQKLTLLTASHLLSGHPPALRRRALKHLARAGVSVQEHCPVEAIVYAAVAQPWPRRSGRAIAGNRCQRRQRPAPGWPTAAWPAMNRALCKSMRSCRAPPTAMSAPSVTVPAWPTALTAVCMPCARGRCWRRT